MSGVPASLAQTAVALAVFYLLYRALLRHDTHLHLNRLYLVGSLVLAFALPLIDLPSPFRTVVVSSLPVQSIGLGQVPADQVDWGQVALGVYLLGVGIMLIRLGWRLWRLAEFSTRQPVVLEDGLRVVYLDDDCPPFSFFRTVFMHRPADADAGAVAQIVAHERAHIRQGHSIDVLIVHLAAVLQWFNPVLWGYRNALTDVHEFLADREVLRQGHDRSAYATLLLAHNLGGSPLMLAHQFRHSQIRRRLDMMTRNSGRWTVARYLLVLPVIALLAVAYAEPRIVAAGDTPAMGVPAAGQQSANPTEKEIAAKKAAQEKATQEKADKVEVDKQLKMLEKKYNATTDPSLKKEIELKMKQLAASNGGNGNTLKVSLDDPAALEDMITKISQKMASLEAKRDSTTDAQVLAKIDQDLKSLKMKRSELKTALAQLKGDKQK